MSEKQSGTTAEGMAILRAIESQKPEEVQICYDPIALALVSGYKFTLSKLVIDSGMYERMVPGALAFIAQYFGSDSDPLKSSGVIFDYFYTETLRDMSRLEVKAMQLAARVTGEGYLFGIDQGQIEPFLTLHGFCVVHNATAGDLKQLYFSGANARHVLPTGCDIVAARVCRGGE